MTSRASDAQKDGMHFSEGGYEHISKKLFNELNVGVYYLEYDTERAGGFEVRRRRSRSSLLLPSPSPPPRASFDPLFVALVVRTS